MTTQPPRVQEYSLDEVATTWFVRMRSDAVSAADRQRFRIWLEEDSAHRQAYAEAEALWREMGEIPDPRDATDDPVTAATATGTIQAAMARGGGIPRYGVLAACLVVAVCAIAVFGGAFERLRADHSTAVGEIASIALPDGSTMTLNTDSAVSIDFDSAHRRLTLLKGEAFFAVSPDSARPFEVAAASGIARAVGTAFNVRELNGSVTVGVAEGRVQVMATSEQRKDETLILDANMAALIDDTGISLQQGANVASLTAWREGKLVFEDRPLRALVEEIDRHRPGIVLLVGSGIGDQPFSGVVSIKDTDSALDAIESTLPVDVIRVGEFLTLLRGRD
ncbi:MAG: FecR family protein [Pseudomonadota bacterium]